MYFSKNQLFMIFICFIFGIFLMGMADRLLMHKNYYSEFTGYSNQRLIGIGIKEETLSNTKTPSGILKIINVLPNSPAMKAGIREGDILKDINGKTVKSKKDVQNLLTTVQSGEKISFNVFRHRKNISFIVEIRDFYENK